MRTARIKSPAKINLYLEVINKLKSGYHNIETVFERVSLCDDVTIALKKSGINVECNKKEIPQDERNLAYRAAKLFLNATGKKIGIRIKINKCIPVSGGLGGGSSNAASVLLGLNRLLKKPLSIQQLLKIGSTIGSDVPFFILNKTNAIGRQRGDVLTPICGRRIRHYVLVNPNLTISTKETYGKLKLGLTKKRTDAKMWTCLLKKDVTTLSKRLYNSLERVVLDKYPILKYIKRLLISYGARVSLVSGSGGTVFGLVTSRKEAMAIRNKMLTKHPVWQVEVARSY